jgi:FixJ family two-component response regulator
MMGPPVIAVIDDDPSVRAATVALLRSNGYRTEAYQSAEGFIADVDRSEAACLVVDVLLEDISGIELGHYLASLGYTFPIVFVTGSNDQGFQKQAMELGCVAYLLKPVAAEQLLDAVVQGVGQAES